MNKERNISLDITRIIAVLAVVMIHTNVKFVTSYNTATPEFFWGNIFDSISRIGVPLFVMISGALMLDENRNISIKSLFLKNIKNIAFLLIFWSVLYSCIYNIVFPLSKGESLSFKRIVSSMLLGHYHMWYLYMIIGLYLITPFLREFISKKNKNLILLFFAVSVLTQFSQPILNALSLLWNDVIYFVKFIEKFRLDFFGGFITYYIIGWYLTNIKIKKKWSFYCMGFFSLLITVLYVQITKDYSNGYSNMNLLILLYSVAVFIALNCGKKWTPDSRLKNIIEVLSKLSFGVYIVHPLFLTVFRKMFGYTKAPLQYILICYVVVTILSFASCFAASKIPGVKKLIRA